MIFILLVYAYESSSSQTCLLKYQFLAPENVSRDMSGPTVTEGSQINKKAAAQVPLWFVGIALKRNGLYIRHTIGTQQLDFLGNCQCKLKVPFSGAV